MTPLDCFLLSTSSRDRSGRFEMTLYAISMGQSVSDDKRIKIIIDSYRPPFFVNRSLPAPKTHTATERKELPLTSMHNECVDCLYFSTFKTYTDCARQLRSEGHELFESDIHPLERFLMERYVMGNFEIHGSESPHSRYHLFHNPVIKGYDTASEVRFRIMSIDIETNARTDEIYSIACNGKCNKVFIIGEETNDDSFEFCANEKKLLIAFFDHVRNEDPDILIGWNVLDFDLWIVQKRSLSNGIPFDLGRDPESRMVQLASNGQIVARIPGRVVMDVPHMLRAYYHTYEEYSLNFVASALLGKQKTIEKTGQAKIDEIDRRFREDKKALAGYNLQDAILTREIFDKAEVLQNAVERCRRSGHLIDRTGGSIAAFDYLYLPRLHRAGYVAPDNGNAIASQEPLPGGYVLEPAPGLYQNVLVFDFRSLYPSIIMTFRIDPLGLIAPSEQRRRGPVGPSFAEKPSILPDLIEQLMEARAKAKKKNNPYLSQAIKILMNSFYGVLGATSCRFFSAELSSTITRTGQYILKQTIEYIEKQKKLPVIYGDTDSLFVNLGPGRENEADATGSALASDISAWLTTHMRDRFNVESKLQLEYQTHFRHFFMPAVRGGTQGSKKHYCGTVVEKDVTRLLFKGMESVRSDWTDLAKEFQNELYTRVFSGTPYEDYIIATVSKVRHGELDHKLIYKKRLRKGVEQYTAAVPPHVQAARLLPSPGYMIRYFITKEGPQPVENRSAAIDYEHYVESQLRPVADSILEWLGTGFDKIITGQQDLFG